MNDNSVAGIGSDLEVTFSEYDQALADSVADQGARFIDGPGPHIAILYSQAEREAAEREGRPMKILAKSVPFDFADVPSQTRPTLADLDHLLAALSIEKSKTIPEIRDMYGLTEGERP